MTVKEGKTERNNSLKETKTNEKEKNNKTIHKITCSRMY